MEKTALLFSGQGAHYEGMGKDLAAGSAEAAVLYEQASDLLGYSLLDLSSSQLSDTRYAQTATFVLSMASYAALAAETGPEITLCPAAGFSLGEYTALTAAGVIRFEDTLRLLEYRASAMSDAAAGSPGGMYAVIGLDDQDILSVLAEEQYKGRVFPANFNSPGQLVIAGYEPDTGAAAERFREMGARKAVRLDVSGAFHTPLMEPAALSLGRYARQFSFGQPNRPVFSNVSGAENHEFGSLPDYFAKHMMNPVRWTDIVRNLELRGVTRYVELGPGKTLCGLVKRTAGKAGLLNVENMKTLQAAAETLRA